MGFDFFGFGGVAVILGGDGDFAAFEVFDGLVAAAVAEFEFVGGGAEGVGDDLVAEADAEDGELVHEFADGLVGVGEGGRIAWTVGEEDAVGVKLADGFGGGVGGDDGYFEVMVGEAFEDGAFDAVVEGDDMEFFIMGIVFSVLG